MQNPTLVVMAAGMGSRFGGLKQIAAVDERGHAIIDYSLYDAYKAGFRNVAFIIKHEIEDDFKKAVGRRMEKYFHVDYIFQQLDRLPAGYSIPEGRVKPWGTGHAILCCKGIVKGPFAVINADDYYGPAAYSAIYDFLSRDRGSGEHAMVAYNLINTVTEHGTVARGICQVENSFLSDVEEHTKIKKDGENAAYTEDDGKTWVPVSGQVPVSMNLWGFQNSMLQELEDRFPRWLDENVPANPLKCEYFLPTVANALIKEKKASVRVLSCHETWYGITYREDMQNVAEHIKDMHIKGIYPDTLLD